MEKKTLFQRLLYLKLRQKKSEKSSKKPNTLGNKKSSQNHSC